MSVVVATRPLTSTREPAPKRIPFVLSSNTRPFDDRVPKISETLPPVTRLTETELDDGMLKFVTSPRSMLNERQSIREELVN